MGRTIERVRAMEWLQLSSSCKRWSPSYATAFIQWSPWLRASWCVLVPPKSSVEPECPYMAALQILWVIAISPLLAWGLLGTWLWRTGISWRTGSLPVGRSAEWNDLLGCTSIRWSRPLWCTRYCSTNSHAFGLPTEPSAIPVPFRPLHRAPMGDSRGNSSQFTNLWRSQLTSGFKVLFQHFDEPTLLGIKIRTGRRAWLCLRVAERDEGQRLETPLPSYLLLSVFSWAAEQDENLALDTINRETHQAPARWQAGKCIWGRELYWLTMASSSRRCKARARSIQEFFFWESSFIIMDDNALNEEFWSNHNTYIKCYILRSSEPHKLGVMIAG